MSDIEDIRRTAKYLIEMIEALKDDQICQGDPDNLSIEYLDERINAQGSLISEIKKGIDQLYEKSDCFKKVLNANVGDVSVLNKRMNDVEDLRDKFEVLCDCVGRNLDYITELQEQHREQKKMIDILTKDLLFVKSKLAETEQIKRGFTYL